MAYNYKISDYVKAINGELYIKLSARRRAFYEAFPNGRIVVVDCPKAELGEERYMCEARVYTDEKSMVARGNGYAYKGPSEEADGYTNAQSSAVGIALENAGFSSVPDIDLDTERKIRKALSDGLDNIKALEIAEKEAVPSSEAKDTTVSESTKKAAEELNKAINSSISTNQEGHFVVTPAPTETDEEAKEDIAEPAPVETQVKQDEPVDVSVVSNEIEETHEEISDPVTAETETTVEETVSAEKPTKPAVQNVSKPATPVKAKTQQLKMLDKAVAEANGLCEEAQSAVAEGYFEKAKDLYNRAAQIAADVAVSVIEGQTRHRATENEKNLRARLTELSETVSQPAWTKLSGTSIFDIPNEEVTVEEYDVDGDAPVLDDNIVPDAPESFSPMESPKVSDPEKKAIEDFVMNNVQDASDKEISESDTDIQEATTVQPEVEIDEVERRIRETEAEIARAGGRSKKPVDEPVKVEKKQEASKNPPITELPRLDDPNIPDEVKVDELMGVIALTKFLGSISLREGQMKLGDIFDESSPRHQNAVRFKGAPKSLAPQIAKALAYLEDYFDTYPERLAGAVERYRAKDSSRK